MRHTFKLMHVSFSFFSLWSLFFVETLFLAFSMVGLTRYLAKNKKSFYICMYTLTTGLGRKPHAPLRALWSHQTTGGN